MSRLGKWLSRANYARKWRKAGHRTSASVHAQRQTPGAPDAQAVNRLFARLKPYDTGISLRRIGPDFDGGYLVPEDLDGIAALFSPGVDVKLGFDLEIAQGGVPAHLADASVSRPSDMAENMTFEAKFIGPEDDGQFMKMDSWVDRYAPGADDLMLQMDIEGAEYAVLDKIPEALLSRFRIILLEIHDLDQVFEPAFHARAARVFDKLNSNHVLCHIHANNAAQYYTLDGALVPPVVEATYIRRDRVRTLSDDNVTLPHPQDQTNMPKLPDPGTPAFWAR